MKMNIYFVSTLLNARWSSSFYKTFHVSFNLCSTWSAVYQLSADLQIPNPRNAASVGFVEKWVRTNDMHCTCERSTSLQLHGLFLGGTHSARASQVYVRYEALTVRVRKKTADPSPRSTATQSAGHWRVAYWVVMVHVGFLKSTIYTWMSAGMKRGRGQVPLDIKWYHALSVTHV